MAQSSGIKNSKKLSANITTINTKMGKLATAMKNQRDAVNKMMKGNADGPYWNGKKAHTYYKKVTGNLDRDIEDYQTAYRNLKTLANLIDGISTKDN